MENEPILLKCLAGRMDNLMTTSEEKQYIIQKIHDNDLADIRDALVSESGRSESLRKALMGPLPTQEEIDSWLTEWGDRYLPFLNPDITGRMKREQEPLRQLMDCVMDWIVTVFLMGGTGILAYFLGWWVPLIPTALMVFYVHVMMKSTATTEFKGKAKRRTIWAHTTPFARCLFALFGALGGLGVRFVVWLLK